MDTETKSSRAAAADKLLLEWERRSLLASLAHARSANRSGNWDVRLGVASAALTAVVGTAIFASIAHDVSTLARVIAGSISVLAAVLTAVQTFAALGPRKEAYERAARRHSAVRRQIELVRAQLAAGEDFDIWAHIEEIRKAGDEAAADSPNASPRLFNRTRRELKNELTWFDKIRRRSAGLAIVRARLSRGHWRAAPSARTMSASWLPPHPSGPQPITLIAALCRSGALPSPSSPDYWVMMRVR